MERELLAGIRVNHRPVADRCVQPDAHGTVDVLTDELVFVVWFVAADQDPHEDLVVQLVDDDLARESPLGLRHMLTSEGLQEARLRPDIGV
jgi:hypothetical protein